MINLIRGDWYYLRHHVFKWLLPTITIVCVGFVGAIRFFQWQGFEAEYPTIAFIEGFAEVLGQPFAWFLALSCVHETFNYTLKNRLIIQPISIGYSRSQIFITKWLVAWLLLAFYIVFTTVIFTVCCVVAFQLSPVTVLEHIAFNELLLAWTIASTVISMTLMCSTLFARGIWATVAFLTLASIFIQLLLDWAPSLRSVEPFFFIFLDIALPPIHQLIWISLIYNVVFLAIGHYFFARKNIQ
ncbi:MAG: hypothetical protein Q4B80_01140 [Aerococcaceae bacterium]|nr:hypothetical protein [Aerococcaceae bacterium]